MGYESELNERWQGARQRLGVRDDDERVVRRASVPPPRIVALERKIVLIAPEPKPKPFRKIAIPERIPKPMGWKTIIFEVCNAHGVTVHEMLGKQRSYRIVKARHEAMWRMTKETQMSLPQIGRHFGGRDHTTVLHAARSHEKRMAQRGSA